MMMLLTRDHVLISFPITVGISIISHCSLQLVRMESVFIVIYLLIAAIVAYPVPTNVDLGANVGFFGGTNDYSQEAGTK